MDKHNGYDKDVFLRVCASFIQGCMDTQTTNIRWTSVWRDVRTLRQCLLAPTLIKCWSFSCVSNLMFCRCYLAVSIIYTCSMSRRCGEMDSTGKCIRKASHTNFLAWFRLDFGTSKRLNNSRTRPNYVGVSVGASISTFAEYIPANMHWHCR